MTNTKTTNKYLVNQIDETSDYINSKIKTKPEIGVILGSGLNSLIDEIKDKIIIPYDDIPHFPVSTVEFHKGKLIIGKINEKQVILMQGRFHYYEGYSMKQITFPVRVLKSLGVHTLLISNACGSINPKMKPGDIMLITDHINLLGDNPLIGENDNSLGPRFPDMSEPYDKQLIALVDKVAIENKINIHKGVYAAMTGPSLETAAEYRFLQIIKADTVGMSTVPENIVAIHSGMKVIGFSVITDACIPEELKPVNISEILKNARKAEPNLTLLMKSVIERL